MKWEVVLSEEEKKIVREVFSLGFEARFDFSLIHGLTGAKSLPILREAVRGLGTEGTPNYWVADVPGNIGIACARLAEWAEKHPEAFWETKKK